MNASSELPIGVTSPNPSEGGGQEELGSNGKIEISRAQDAEAVNVAGVKSIPLDENDGRTEAGYITANPYVYPYIKDCREELKRNPTEAEKIIWEYLRAKKTGYKIRRQHVIDNYIADFVCLSQKVVIEIDGEIHLQQKEQDEQRTYALNDVGYKVIRFTNEEVISNSQLVADQIKEVLNNRDNNL